jgi:hypothetical protein
MAFEFTKPLLKTGECVSLLPIWLFSDLHGTLLKIGLKPLASFQKGFVKIRETVQPMGRKG